MKKISLQSLKRFGSKWLGVLPLLISLSALILLTRASANPVFHIPYVAGPYFNIVLLGGASFFVAYLAWRGFAVSGLVQILLFGGGALSLGMATVLGSMLSGQPNTGITVHNIGALVSSVLFLTGAAMGLGGTSSFERQKHKNRLAFSVYAIVLLLPFLFWALSSTGVTPTFFISGQGGTLVRTVVLDTTLSLFAISGLAFIWLNRRTRGSFLHWYGLGLLLFALGLYAWQFVRVSDDSFSWLGRLTQYLGGIYFITAILAALRETHAKCVPAAEFIASFFRRRSGHELLESLKEPAFEMLIVMLLLTILFASLNITRGIEFAYLNLALYTICVIVPSFFMAVITIRTFLRTGSWPAIWLGIGAFTFALGNLLGSLLVARSTTNIAVTASNIIYFAGGAFHLIGSFFVVNQISPRGNHARRTATVLQVYLSTLAFIAFVTIASIRELLPPFFVQGEGGTALRQMVVGATAGFFLVSGIVIFTRYLKTKSNLLYWYSMGLLFIFLGMVGIFLLASLGTPLNWVGRTAQYLGGLCLLMATLTTLREARSKKVEVEEMLAGFFQSPARSYGLVTDASIDAVITADIEERILLWNAAAAKIFGYSSGEAMSLTISDLFTEEGSASLKQELRKLERLKQKELVLKPAINEEEITATRKDGSTFPAIFSISARETPLGWISVVTIRDITERKRAEEALQESEEKYRTIIETASEGIWISDTEGRTTFVNKRMAEMIGYSPEELIGKLAYDFMDEEAKALGRLNLERRRQGLRDSFEQKYIRKDGTTLWALVSATPLWNKDGQITAYMDMLTDIIKRKRAEDALRESEMRFRSVLDNSQDVIYRLSVQTGRYDYISPSAETVVGFSPDELMALDIETSLAMIHPDDLPAMRAALARLEDTGKGEMEYRQRTKNGDYRWISNHMALIRDSAGRPLYRNGNIRDITELKRAEEALQKAHDKLEAQVQERTAKLSEANKTLLAEIAERKRAEEQIREQATLLYNAQEAIGVRSLEHRLIYWNNGAERLYGWTAQEAIGKNPVEFLFKDKEESLQLIEAKRIVLEKGEWIGELHQVTKDGREVIVESHWTLIYDSEGKPKSILVVNTDITEKKMFEAHLLRAQRMESIGTLAGGIAHDLNNMLTPMMMSLQMLKGKFKDEQSQKMLTILEKNSQRSADLIKQVLSFSRGVEGERNPLAAKHLILEIEKIAKETFPRNIEIRTDIQKDLFTISGDATQLHQVIMNLCVNARDAMPNGGILGISAENFLIDENYARMHTEANVGSYVTIAVSDTGIGISSKILDRIFEPFFTTKEFGKGTGLGLSTALAIVKSHGGFINVYSEVGKGTTFRVYLPAIKTKTEMQDAEEEQLELLVGHGELVLVAEDEDSVRNVTISTLEEYGYSVLAAGDGADAVALYAQNKNKVEVILMDMMMPIMDGEASIRTTRKINPDVKIIAVSGLAEKERLAKVADLANAFLPKPYTAEKLLKTITEVLRGM